jgi:hypothetical protein
MAYNPYMNNMNYPMSYQQNNPYSGTYPQMTNQNPQQATSMRADWVQGEPAARAYNTAPGMLTLLMDSDQPVLYVKMTDQSGRPQPLEVYDLVKRETYQQQIPQWSGNNQTQKEYIQQDLSEYVKKDELQQMVSDAVVKAMQNQNGSMQK